MCGIYGEFKIRQPNTNLERGMSSMYHRGHNGGGFAQFIEGNRIICEKDFDLKRLLAKREVPESKIIAQMGHTRWPTAGGNDKINMHPHFKSNPSYKIFVCVNGDLVNMQEQVEFLKRKDIKVISGNDGEMMCGSIFWQLDKQYKELKQVNLDQPVELDKTHIVKAIQKTMKYIKGAYSSLFMAEFDEALYGFRDPHGFRPMIIGMLESRYIICSETCQLDEVGARFLREVRPGEIVRISDEGLESFVGQKSKRKAFCSFELLYFLRPDSNYHYVKKGKDQVVPVDEVRYQLGSQIGKEVKKKSKQRLLKADIVVPVPRSGRPAAIGLSHETGVPLREALIVKPRVFNPVGRTFIEADEGNRRNKARMKYKFIREVVQDKRIILVDDSLIRGLTMETLVEMAYEAGAKEVFVVIAAPKYLNPCYYGSDTKDISKLVARDKRNDELIKSIGEPDELVYITLGGFKKVINAYTCGSCFACFDGDYAVPVPFLQ